MQQFFSRLYSSAIETQLIRAVKSIFQIRFIFIYSYTSMQRREKNKVLQVFIHVGNQMIFVDDLMMINILVNMFHFPSVPFRSTWFISADLCSREKGSVYENALTTWRWHIVRRDYLAFYSNIEWIARQFIFFFISFVNGNSCLKDAACITTVADLPFIRSSASN